MNTKDYNFQGKRRTVNNSLAPRTSRKESRREVFAAADTRRCLATFGYRG